MNILMVVQHMPAPTIGVNTRNYHLLRALAREHDVSLLVLGDDQNPTYLRGLARDVRVVGAPAGVKRLKQAQYLAQGRSYRVMAATVAALQTALDKLCARERFDAVLFESVLLAGYRLSPGVKVIIDQHNIEYELMRRSAQREPPGLRKVYNWLESVRLEPIELQRCAAADLVLVTSERERLALLRRIPGSRIEVAPNGVDLQFFRRAAVPDGDTIAADAGPRIVFTGAMNYAPNVDAAVAFAQACWPRIRALVPDAIWQIVGKDPLPAVQRLAHLPGVVVTGSVADVRPYLAAATAAIVPLRVGGGTRLKILEAFAMELPVVATSLGSEGLSVVPGEHLLLADTPTELVEAVVRCLGDASLRASLAAAGHALARAEYGWDHIGDRLLRAVRSVGESSDTVPLEIA